MQPLENVSPEADWDDSLDFASGGRVPLDVGGISQLVRQGKLGYAGKDKKLTKEQLKEMLNVKKPKHYKESPWAITDDWLKRLKEKFSKADGGRVPLGKGKLAKYATPEGLAELMEKLFPGTTKLGKTSRPMAPKTELKRAVAGFQERENLAKELESFRGQIDDNIIREIAAMDPAKQLKAIEDVKLYLRNMKNLRQETTLREFDIKGQKGHATGGRVSLSAGGLAGMLGE